MRRWSCPWRSFADTRGRNRIGELPLNLAGIGSNSQGNDQPTRLLVVGAGVAGQTLVKEIQEHKLPVEPVAFLDDDPRLTGTTVCGLPVHGTTDDLVEVAARVQAQEVLLAIPSSGGALVRRLVILCKRAKLPFKIVPGLRDIILGDVHFSHVSAVKPDQLLGRETVDLRAAVARELVAGRTVMVTGAGGSIGGELCRQVMSLVPKKLILLGGDITNFGEPDDVAGVIDYLLSDQSAWITGQVFGVDGGLATVRPRQRA